MSLPNLSGTAPASSSSFSVGPFTAKPGNDTVTAKFVDRRNAKGAESEAAERRQFGSSHAGLSDDGRELAFAIDRYKVRHHRRYLTCDEMLTVLERLGYAKQAT